MFNKIFKFLKKSTVSPSNKQKSRIFLAKDLRQYRVEYFNVINYMVGKNFPLGNKSIDFENLKLIKLIRMLVQLILFYYLYIIFFF